MRCFVLWCTNSSTNHPEGVTFHRIPENKSSEWLKAIKRPVEPLPPSSRRICSEHFTTDSFFNIRGKYRTLKPFAIPSLKLTSRQQLPVR
ncbi:hypothetical protein JTB14_012336 [Gonioctena quinquepunctata]|nr:hypothetical protein JTB14_012336 [Gonioctena quinquepunctata]